MKNYQLNYYYYDKLLGRFICSCRYYSTLSGVIRFLLKNHINNYICINLNTLEEVLL